MSTRKNDSISIRFDDRTKADLQAIADQSHLTAADLVRRAVDDLIAKVRAEGRMAFEVKLPPSSKGKS